MDAKARFYAHQAKINPPKSILGRVNQKLAVRQAVPKPPVASNLAQGQVNRPNMFPVDNMTPAQSMAGFKATPQASPAYNQQMQKRTQFYNKADVMNPEDQLKTLWKDQYGKKGETAAQKLINAQKLKQSQYQHAVLDADKYKAESDSNIIGNAGNWLADIKSRGKDLFQGTKDLLGKSPLVQSIQQRSLDPYKKTALLAGSNNQEDATQNAINMLPMGGLGESLSKDILEGGENAVKSWVTGKVAEGAEKDFAKTLLDKYESGGLKAAKNFFSKWRRYPRWRLGIISY